MSVGDRVVLYHRVSRTALVLNPTGGWMWDRLPHIGTVAELAQELRERFPSLSLDEAERDVQAFLADLRQHAMVAEAP